MRRSGRRSFLRSLAVALGAVCLRPSGLTSARDLGRVRSTIIGYSQWDQPLTICHLGDGDSRVFLLGGQHGGTEANTVDLASLVLAHFADNPADLPPNIGLDIMPVGNPDGLWAGSRQYLSGVDPNRNWATPDWQLDAYDSDGQFREGLGGPEPFSEPETQALAGWLLHRPPSLVVNYHSVGGFVLADEWGLADELAATYAETSGYPWLEGSGPFSYPVTGGMAGWLADVGIPNLFIELATPSDPEFDQNLEGVRAVLARLSEVVAA